MSKFYFWTILISICFGSTINAKVIRTAVFIGNNVGLINERSLRYADKDAEELAEIFTHSSDFNSEDIHLLLNKSVSELIDTLQIIRIGINLSDTIQNVFLFYYSGHGSADALHISGGEFSKSALNEYLQSINAEVKLVVIDACESGDLLRKKGGQVVDEILIEGVDQIDSKGTITITSSAAGELSQESERYKGAVFSHHFKNGLRGLADYNVDNEVHLWEAFHYAKVSTNADNIANQQSAQHPSFDFNIVGKSDLVLTKLQKEKNRLIFKGMGTKVIQVYNANTMEQHSTIWLNGKSEVSYQLPAGVYILSYKEQGVVKIAKVDLSWKSEEVVGLFHFITQQQTLFSTKGGHKFSIDPHGTMLDVSYIRTELANTVGVEAGYVYRGRVIKHAVSLLYAADQLLSKELEGIDGLSTDRVLLGFIYTGLFTPFFYTYFSTKIGVQLSFIKIFDTNKDYREFLVSGIEESIITTQTQANVYRVGIPIELEFTLPYGIWLIPKLRYSLYMFKDGYTNKNEMEFALEPALGLGYQF